SLASIAMVINSGVSLVIPQHIIKAYEKWISPRHIYRFYLVYSAAFLILYVAVLLGIYIDRNYLRFVDYYDENIVLYMTFIFAGFYFLGYYYYYSNVLFYHRKSAIISRVTLVTSAINLIITIFLTYQIGILGAAIAAMITYIFYFIFIYRASSSVEKRLKQGAFNLGVVSVVCALLLFMFGYIFSFYLFQ